MKTHSKHLLILPTILIIIFVSLILSRAGTVFTEPASTAANYVVVAPGHSVNFNIDWTSNNISSYSIDYGSSVMMVHNFIQSGNEQTATLSFPESLAGKPAQRIDVIFSHNNSGSGFCSQEKDVIFYVIVPKITSTAVATTPTDQTRTTIGVGEDVDCSTTPTLPSGYTPTWSVDSPGIIDHDGNYTAGDVAGTETVTLKDSSGNQLDQKAFTIEAPTGMHCDASTCSAQHVTPLLGPVPNAGFNGQMYVDALDVCFSNVEVGEEVTVAHGSGYFGFNDGVAHENSEIWAPLDTNNVTQLQDIVRSGYNYFYSYTTSGGSMTLDIPVDYKVNGVTHNGFFTEHAPATCNTAGTVVITKNLGQDTETLH